MDIALRTNTINYRICAKNYEIIFFILLGTIFTPFEFYDSGIRALLFNVAKILPIAWVVYFSIKGLRKKFSNYEKIILIDCLLMMFVGLFNVALNYNGSLTFFNINLYIIIAVYLSGRISVDSIHTAFLLTSLIGIASFVFFYFYRGYDLKTITGQSWSGYVWTESFYYCSILWATPYLVLLSFVRGKKILLGSITWVIYILFNLLFLKRYVLADSALIVLCLAIHFLKIKKSLKQRKLMIVFGTSLFIISYYFIFVNSTTAQLFASLFGRFISSVSNGISEFDRFKESFEYFSNCGVFKSVFGGGFYNYFYSINENTTRFNLHIGWFDFAFKGGFLFLTILLIPYINVPYGIKHYRQLSDYKKFILLASIMNLFRFLYSGTSAFYPSMFMAILIIVELAKIKSLRGQCE